MRKFSLRVLVVYLACVLLPAGAEGYSIRSETTYNTTTLQNVAIYTPLQRVNPSTNFNLSFILDGDGDRPVKLVLSPNHDLMLQDPHIRYIGGDGGHRTELLRRDSNKVFRGRVLTESIAYQWEEVGWARVNIIRDGYGPLFTGAFSMSGVEYSVKLQRNPEEPSNRQMVVQHTPETASLSSPDPLWTGPLELFRRQFTPTISSSDLVETIGDDDGCPSDRQIALVGIATDCSYTAEFDSSEDLVQELVTMVNTASEVFETAFNIALSFHNLTISESNCPSNPDNDEGWNTGCSAGDLNFRLQEFSRWRGNRADDDNAYWTLMTGCPTGTEVGVSWVGELCNGDMGANVVASASNQWQVFAHESGHTFGAYHDCDSTTCTGARQCCPLSSSTCSANARYIMNPVSTSPQTDFSPCTIGNVCSAMSSRRVDTRCLTTNANTPIVTAGECGNGIVEVGEECDCGDECDGNECCDGDTCRFRDDAVCDDASGGCCDGCQFMRAGAVCRAAVGECDIEETCPGDSGDCPDDETEDDGESCGDGDDLFCSSGQCTNRDLQCQGQMTGDNSTISSCGNTTCTLSCSSFSGASCSRVGDVLDGTPCDNGLCRSGVCRSSSSDGGDVGSWVDRNKALVIGLSAGIGGFLVLALLICLVCCCCRRKPKTMVPVPVSQMPLPAHPRGVPPGQRGYVPPPAYSPRPMQSQTPYFRYA